MRHHHDCPICTLDACTKAGSTAAEAAERLRLVHGMPLADALALVAEHPSYESGEEAERAQEEEP